MDSKAYIVDPVSTNEMADVARYSGHPAIHRKSLSHALNLHFVARKVADELETPLSEARFIVAHLGGGISIAPVRGGKIIDVNDATNEGPFSTTRSGSLPTVSLAEFILDSNLNYPEARGELLKNAGLFGYLNEYDGSNLARKIKQGDESVRNVVDAMAYQIGKEIGAMSTVLHGDVHRIIVTGGLANFEYLVNGIREQTEWIAESRLLPGEFELEALAGGVQRVLTGEESPKTYPTS
jgi:butyrate kinase